MQLPVKNASVNDELIKKISLTGKNSEDYFITAYDKTSTFGAQTNIVVYENGTSWSVIKAPFKRGLAEDRNNDGVYEVVDYYPVEKIYLFENGVFREKPVNSARY
ncbi:MAG: hypothetical protein JXA66_08205 [Oligoflexia bacterium]|nr:hypothetical protein [Oligoflexia bacterium]